jgi:REP element-mobilizing transposase RayT
MPFDPNVHHRRSIRLSGYDYSRPGSYFVTNCTYKRELFLEDRAVKTIAEHCWRELPSHFPYVRLDEWVVMPNHLHGIVIITGNAPPQSAPRPDNRVTPLRSPQRGSLGLVIRTYKAAVTTACRDADLAFGWQRGFYERIIRKHAGLVRTRRYIRQNPQHWETDEYHPTQSNADP